MKIEYLYISADPMENSYSYLAFQDKGCIQLDMGQLIPDIPAPAKILPKPPQGLAKFAGTFFVFLRKSDKKDRKAAKIGKPRRIAGDLMIAGKVIYYKREIFQQTMFYYQRVIPDR